LNTTGNKTPPSSSPKPSSGLLTVAAAAAVDLACRLRITGEGDADWAG